MRVWRWGLVQRFLPWKATVAQSRRVRSSQVAPWPCRGQMGDSLFGIVGWASRSDTMSIKEWASRHSLHFSVQCGKSPCCWRVGPTSSPFRDGELTVESTLTGHSSEVRGCRFPRREKHSCHWSRRLLDSTWSVGSDGVKPSGWPEESTAQELPDRVLCVDMSACHVACACGDGTVQLFVQEWRSDGEIHAHSGSALCCAFSPCGSFLATGGADCT